MCRRGFTLVEVVVATVLTTVLLGIVLSATAALSRDRKRLEAAAVGPSTADVQAVVQRFRADLQNARSCSAAADGRTLTITGYAGLSESSLRPSGRLTEIRYQIRAAGGGRGSGGEADAGRTVLVRQQRYLDDPLQVEPWTELVATDVRYLSVSATSPDADTMPAQVTLQVQFATRAIEERLWLR